MAIELERTGASPSVSTPESAHTPDPVPQSATTAPREATATPSLAPISMGAPTSDVEQDFMFNQLYHSAKNELHSREVAAEELVSNQSRSPSSLDVWTAAFVNHNSLSSAIVNEPTGHIQPVEGYNPYTKDGEGKTDIDGYENFWQAFKQSGSPEETRVIKRKIDREVRNQEILAQGDVEGVLASVAAGVVDPINLLSALIPVAGQYSVTKSIGVGIVGAAATETALQETQETRTEEETAINIAASAILSGLMQNVSNATVDLVTKGQKQLLQEQVAKSVGAAQTEAQTLLGSGAEIVSNKNPLNYLAKQMAKITPLGRTLQSDESIVRSTVQDMVESSIRLEGDFAPTAVESLIKLDYSKMAQTEIAVRKVEQQWMKANGSDRLGFNIALSNALRTGDQAGDPLLQQAVDQIRTSIDDLWNRAAQARVAGTFRELEDGTVEPIKTSTADSYLTRRYDLNVVRADPEGHKRAWMRGLKDQHEREYRDALAEYEAQVLELNKKYEEAQAKAAAKFDEDIAKDLDARQAEAEAPAQPETRELPDVEYVEIENDEFMGQPVNSIGLEIYGADGKNLGYIKNRFNDDGSLQVFDSEVDPSMRGQGLGTEMYLEMISRAKAAGVDTLTSDSSVSESAAAIWEKLGATKSKSQVKSVARQDNQRMQMDTEDGDPLYTLDLNKFDGIPSKKPETPDVEQPDVDKLYAKLEGVDDEINKIIDDPFNYNDLGELNRKAQAKLDKAMDRQSKLEQQIADAKKVEVVEEPDIAAKAADDTKNYEAARALYVERKVKKPKLPPKPTPRAQMDDAELYEVATNIHNKIIQLREGDLHFNTGPSGAAMLKNRVNVRDEFLNDYLVKDWEGLLQGYTKSLAPKVRLAERFGEGEDGYMLKNRIDDIYNEYEQKITRLNQQMDKAPDASEKKKLQKERDKLSKKMNSEVRDIVIMRDRLLNITQEPSMLNPENRGVLSALRTARSWNVATMLSNVVVASAPDVARTLTYNGGIRYIKAFAKSFNKTLRRSNLPKDDMAKMASAMDRAMNYRLGQLTEVEDGIIYTRADKYAHYVADKAMVFSGIKHWNSLQKTIAGHLVGDKIGAHLAKGTGRAELRRLGITDEMYDAARTMYKQHGSVEGGMHNLGLDMWGDVRLVEAFEAAAIKETDTLVVTPSAGDKPILMTTEYGRTLFQFKSFMVAATNRMLLPLMQEKGIRPWVEIVGSLGVGAAVYQLRQMAAGKEPEDDPAELMVHAIDSTGLPAYAIEAMKVGQAATGVDTLGLEEDAKYYSRGPWGTILGPSVQQAQNVWKSAYGLPNAVTGSPIEGAPSPESRAKAMVNLMPMQNHYVLKHGYDKLEEAIASSLE